MKLMFVVFALATAAGQERKELPTDSSPSQTTLTPQPHLVKRGQTPEQVVSVMGLPDAVEHTRARTDDNNAKWYYGTRDLFIVRFVNGTVNQIKKAKAYTGEPTKFERALDRVVQGATIGYLAYSCPTVRRKPMLWLTTNDIQLLKACIAAGL